MNFAEQLRRAEQMAQEYGSLVYVPLGAKCSCPCHCATNAIANPWPPPGTVNVDSVLDAVKRMRGELDPLPGDMGELYGYPIVPMTMTLEEAVGTFDNFRSRYMESVINAFSIPAGYLSAKGPAAVRKILDLEPPEDVEPCANVD